MEIRLLRESDDRHAVSRIYEESWKTAYRNIVPQAYLDSIPAGLWAESLDRAGWDALVLIEEGQPVGTASVCPSRWPQYPDFGEIASLYLLPACMGRGFGRALLNAALKQLADRGFRDVLLWVLEENRRARRFYERNGFRLAGAPMEYAIGGKALNEVPYCRRVP